MAIEIVCPSCRAAFRVSEEIRGKKVRCKSCQEPFTAAEGKPSRQEDRGSPVDDRLKAEPPPPPPVRGRRGRDDEDSGSDLPVVRRRREDKGDRDPPRGRTRKPEKGGYLGLIIGGAIAGVVLLIGGVVGAVLMLKPTSTRSPAPVAQATTVVNKAPANPGVPAVPAPKPDVPAPPAPKPDVPAPAPKPDVPAPPAPKPDVPAPPAPKPDVPEVQAPKPAVPEAPPPAGPNALTYRWHGGPHVYSVLVEIEKEKTIESQRGVLVIRSEKVADGYKLNSASGMVKQEKPRGGAKPAVPQPLPGITTANWINMEPLGKIQSVTRGGIQLPLLLGEMGQFLIQPLPADDRKTWETSAAWTIEQSNGAAPGRGFRGPMFRPKGPKGPKPTLREGLDKSVYTRGDSDGDMLTITKTYEMTVKATAADPALKLTGDQTIHFDMKYGKPRGIEFKGAMAVTGNTISLRYPITATYKLLEGAERDRVLNPPPPPKVQPPPKVEPKVFSDAEITLALADLAGKDDGRRWAAVDQLAKSAKPTIRREEVAKALNPLLEDKNLFHRMACINALAVWGTKDNVPALIAMLADSNGGVRLGSAKALAEIQDERAIEPIAKLLTAFWDRGEAVKALQKFGSKAEKVVLTYLKHTDKGVRTEACKVLIVIGTRASKPALEEAAKDSNVWTRGAAKEALKAIAGRP